MMNTSSDDKSTIRSKLENNDNDEKLSKALARAASSSSATTTTSRQWAGFKNPRIVRVSRTFGGKDRHSKVCTIRGLRDRRIRLSVPTAIQLYDLQDRLGLSQPSKVIDWLLDATKLDIDKLPPLQIPPGNFVDFHQQQALFGNTHQFTPYNLSSMKEGVSNESSSGMLLSSKEGININDDVDVDEDEDEDDEDNSMEVNLESMSKWNKKTSSVDNGGSSSVQSFFPMGGNNGYLMNNAGGLMPYNNMYQWDLSLSQLASHGSSSSSLPSQTEEARHNYSSTHQLFFCPPLATTPLFPQHDNRFHLSNTYGSGFVEEQMHSGENNAGHENKGNNN